MDLIITILPVVTKDLPISPRFAPYNFLSRCKFSTLTTRQPMVESYLLTFPRFPLRKKEHKSYFGKNRTHDFRTTSRLCRLPTRPLYVVTISCLIYEYWNMLSGDEPGTAYYCADLGDGLSKPFLSFAGANPQIRRKGD